jgi:hypothetical protein
MRIRDEPTDLGLGFYLGFETREREEGDASEAFDTEDVSQRPSLGHNVTYWCWSQPTRSGLACNG